MKYGVVQKFIPVFRHQKITKKASSPIELYAAHEHEVCGCMEIYRGFEWQRETKPFLVSIFINRLTAKYPTAYLHNGITLNIKSAYCCKWSKVIGQSASAPYKY